MSDKLRAEWFWTDRWRSSSAVLLPMEARGLYREMLTAAWTLGGWLPADPEQIRSFTFCSQEVWDRCWPLIEAKWKQDGSKIYNETQREIFNKCLTLSEKRALAGARGGRASGKARSKREAKAEATPQANPKQTNPPSPSPSPSKDQAPETATTTPSRKRDKWAEKISAVLEHFKSYHPRARPGQGARSVVRARLKDGYTPADLCQAIDGMESHPHNQGQNERGRKYLSIEIAMREKNVPRFIAVATGEDNGRGTSKSARTLDAIRSAHEADEAGADLFQRGDGGDGSGVRRRTPGGEGSRLLADPADRHDDL